MKPLKRLWDATGTTTAFFATMAGSLAIQGWYWHDISQRYDLDQLASTTAYTLGVLSLVTCATVLGTLAMTIGVLLRRYWPRPLPVDPDLPPTQLVYLQGDGEPERCFCHGKPIEDGTLIWHWPQPAKLVCVKEGDAG
jgi:hypothetical protein